MGDDHRKLTLRRSDPRIALMRDFFAPAAKPNSPAQPIGPEALDSPIVGNSENAEQGFLPAELAWFSSDEETDDEQNGEEAGGEWQEDEDTLHHKRCTPTPNPPPNTPKPNRLPAVPPRKRQRHEIPIRVQRERRDDERKKVLERALVAIQQLLRSKKTRFEGGQNGLQAYRARAIQSYLMLVVKWGRLSVDASERAAESHGFAAKWGGRSLRLWTHAWIRERCLPQSNKGRHGKVYTVLDDPAVRAELRAYVRSNKWAMNPAKLKEFSQGRLVPSAADKYLRQIVRDEMPQGLKKYMEIELFPRIQLKVKKGISLSTARRWLRSEGFRYIGYKKGLYFDGHDRPDVLAYRQNIFLPQMENYFPRLVRYKVGKVDEEVLPANFVDRPVVVVAQDEMTSQAHDTVTKSWVLEDQHALRKKGVGRGLHQSDVICSTVGWLRDASQSLEYGKNYDGYWTGELFVKQVCCFPLQ